MPLFAGSVNLTVALGAQRYEILLDGVGFIKVYVMKWEGRFVPLILLEAQLAGEIVPLVD